MTSEITIFDIPETEHVANKSQKQINYELLAKEQDTTKNYLFGREHITSLYEMDELIEMNKVPKSSIPAILLKYATRFCIPVIADKDAKYFVSLQNTTRSWVLRKTKTPVKNSTESKEGGIDVNSKLLAPIYQATEEPPDGYEFNSMPPVPHKVSGIKLPDKLATMYYRNDLAYYDYVSTRDLAMSGRYGILDLQTQKYTQERKEFSQPRGMVGITTILEFKSDDDVIKACTKIIKYIEHVEKYYHIVFPIISHEMDKPDIYGIYSDNWQIVNGKMTRFIQKIISSSRTKRPEIVVAKTLASKKSKKTKRGGGSNSIELFAEFSQPILNKIGLANKYNFGTSFYYEILSTLDARGMQHIYNIARYVGLDNKTAKKELEQSIDSYKESNDYIKQVNVNFDRQLVIVKKKNIAYDKFKLYTIDDLTPQQKKIVDLEYNKLESKREPANSKYKELFNKMQGAVLNATKIELAAAIKEVEANIDTKDLNGDNLINGVCPHVYQSCKRQLENFGQVGKETELRVYLINRYALPEQSGDGFFCKICGEKIAESDTTALMKFMGDKAGGPTEENPLQIMIWKEAMYIVSTNVRFLTPIPVKPLINSLASGLREIVAQEEAKLYKSKTVSNESIRDTLNLYSTIYIYAAICALIMQNPGKITFARDAPSKYEQTREYNDKIGQNTYLQGSIDSVKGDSSKGDSSNGNDAKGDSANSKAAKDNSSKGDSSKGDSANSKAANGDSSNGDTANGHAVESTSEESIGKSSTNRINSEIEKLRSKSRGIRRIRGGKAINSKMAEKIYITTALKLIFLSKETIINRLRNMNQDLVKQIFVKSAYPWAMKHAKPIQVDSGEDKHSPASHIYYDPIYKYILQIKNILYLRQFINEKHPAVHPIAQHDVRRVLGHDESKIISGVKSGNTIVHDVVIPPKWNLSAIPNMDEYSYNSFLASIEYVKEKIYSKSRVPRHVQFTEHLDKYASLFELETWLRNYYAYRALRPTIQIELLNDNVATYHNFSPEKIDLARHYCKSGEQHETKYYVFAKKSHGTAAKGVTLQLTNKDIINMLKNEPKKYAELAHMRIIDEVCGKCGVHFKRAKSNKMGTMDNLAALFAELDDILAFYQYYETRCPIGNLHDLGAKSGPNVATGKCSKCGFITEYAKTRDATYYKKYKTAFQKVQAEKTRISSEGLKKVAELEKVRHKPEITPKYQFSLKKTAEWSKIADKKYNLLINIGMFEKHKYQDIENAVINPSKTLKSSPARAIQIKGHIHNFLRDYATIINAENVVDFSSGIREIIEKQKKTSDIKDIDTLPKFDDFAKLDEKYKNSLNAEDYCNFLLEYLANIFVTLSNVNKQKYKKMIESLITHFTNKILEKERFMSKPEPYIAKIDVTGLEDVSNDDVSGDEWTQRQLDISSAESSGSDDVETYENEISNDAYDVENAGDIWETE